jgi:CheY-like chemotaxis protein
MSIENENEKPGLRVLVVEDNTMHRKMAGKLLERFGHHASFANDGSEALDQIAGQQPFDVILMDRHMPVMDGLEATRKIRMLPGAEQATPIIAVTGAERQSEIDICLDAGMNDFVAKPIDPERLRTALLNAAAGNFSTARGGPESGDGT